MKKRIVALLMAAVLLTGCGAKEGADPKTSTDTSAVVSEQTETSEASAQTETSVEEASNNGENGYDSLFDVTYYTMEDTRETKYFCILTNNSEDALKVRVNGKALDASGSVLAEDSRKIEVIGPGETSITYLTFKATEIADYECSFEYDTDIQYQPIVKDIKVEQSFTEDRDVLLFLTNTGDSFGTSVEAYALFFDANNKLLEFQTKSFCDVDTLVKPGATFCWCYPYHGYDGYDHVEIYLKGGFDGRTYPDWGFTEEDFSIEYFLENRSNDTVATLLITNNSESPAKAQADVIGYDAAGNILDIDYATHDVIGPGETGIVFCVLDEPNVDHLDCKVSYSANVRDESAISDIHLSAKKDRNFLIVTVTSSEEEKAVNDIRVYALFFDAAGNFVHSGHEDVVYTNFHSDQTTDLQIDSLYGFDSYKLYVGKATK